MAKPRTTHTHPAARYEDPAPEHEEEPKELEPKSEEPKEEPQAESQEPVAAVAPAEPPPPPVTTQVSGYQRPVCPNCGSNAVGLGGGMHICNQCSHTWL